MLDLLVMHGLVCLSWLTPNLSHAFWWWNNNSWFSCQLVPTLEAIPILWVRVSQSVSQSVSQWVSESKANSECLARSGSALARLGTGWLWRCSGTLPGWKIFVAQLKLGLQVRCCRHWIQWGLWCVAAGGLPVHLHLGLRYLVCRRTRGWLR